MEVGRSHLWGLYGNACARCRLPMVLLCGSEMDDNGGTIGFGEIIVGELGVE